MNNWFNVARPTAKLNTTPRALANGSEKLRGGSRTLAGRPTKREGRFAASRKPSYKVAVRRMEGSQTVWKI